MEEEELYCDPLATTGASSRVNAEMTVVVESRSWVGGDGFVSLASKEIPGQLCHLIPSWGRGRVVAMQDSRKAKVLIALSISDSHFRLARLFEC